MELDMNVYEAAYVVGDKHKMQHFLANNLEEALADAKYLHPKVEIVGVALVAANVYFDLGRIIKNAEDFAKVEVATP
jgi:hypothetical protein